MVLRNYVELVPGRPTRLHFTSAQIVTKTVFDKLLGRTKPINTLVLQVDELDEAPVSALLSITSEKFARDLQDYIDRGVLSSFRFTITLVGEDFQRVYSIKVEPQ